MIFYDKSTLTSISIKLYEACIYCKHGGGWEDIDVIGLHWTNGCCYYFIGLSIEPGYKKAGSTLFSWQFLSKYAQWLLFRGLISRIAAAITNGFRLPWQQLWSGSFLVERNGSRFNGLWRFHVFFWLQSKLRIRSEGYSELEPFVFFC